MVWRDGGVRAREKARKSGEGQRSSSAGRPDRVGPSRTKNLAKEKRATSESRSRLGGLKSHVEFGIQGTSTERRVKGSRV